MGVVSKIIDNSISTIEALTPVTRQQHGFKAVSNIDLDSLPRVPGAHRKFSVKYSEEFTVDTSFPWTTGTNMYINRVLDFIMILRLEGRDVVESLKDAAEDADQIIVSLMQVENYTSASDTDGSLVKRDINEGPLIEIDTEEGSAILTMSFTCKYMRTL